MLPRIHGQFGVQDARRDRKLFEEQFHFVATIDRVYKDYRFTANQFQFDERVDQYELLLIFTPVIRDTYCGKQT